MTAAAISAIALTAAYASAVMALGHALERRWGNLALTAIAAVSLLGTALR